MKAAWIALAALAPLSTASAQLGMFTKEQRIIAGRAALAGGRFHQDSSKRCGEIGISGEPITGGTETRASGVNLSGAWIGLTPVMSGSFEVFAKDLVCPQPCAPALNLLVCGKNLRGDRFPRDDFHQPRSLGGICDVISRLNAVKIFKKPAA